MEIRFLLLALSLFSISSMGGKLVSEEKEIPLSSTLDKLAELVKDKRSVIIEPTAAIDGNNIFIYTNVAVERVRISIKG